MYTVHTTLTSGWSPSSRARRQPASTCSISSPGAQHVKRTNAVQLTIVITQLGWVIPVAPSLQCRGVGGHRA